MTNLQNKKVSIISSSFLLALVATLASYGAGAQTVTIPNTFTSGTAAVAAEVNENFDAVATAVNDLGGQSWTADVFTFQLPDHSPAAGDTVGSAQLTRTAAGANLTANSTMLVAGDAYSVWWIIFNNPGSCATASCTDADFGNPEVEASVMNATGRVADADGNATFSAFLPVGFMHTEPASGTLRQVFGPGLQNLAGAEIHIVIRSHGPATGNPEQISTILADCVHPTATGGCYDIQAIVFPIPM